MNIQENIEIAVAPVEPTLEGMTWDIYVVPEFVASYADLARERHHSAIGVALCDESLTEEEQETTAQWIEFLYNREWNTLGVHDSPSGPKADIIVQH